MHRTLRHIVSMVLLAVYLPMVAVSSLHIHHETVDRNDGCRQCAGHIESHHQHQSDCQFCHFLNLFYFGRPSEPSVAPLPDAGMCMPTVVEAHETASLGVAMLRAPPAL